MSTPASTSAPKIAAPTVTPEAAPYWEAAKEGKFLLMRCTQCGEHYHYPRPFCPFCMSKKVEWKEASGEGTIYSFTNLRRPPLGFAPAFVTLAEGPTIITGIVEADPATLAIGQQVRVTYVPSEGGPPVPMFKPA